MSIRAQGRGMLTWSMKFHGNPSRTDLGDGLLGYTMEEGPDDTITTLRGYGALPVEIRDAEIAAGREFPEGYEFCTELFTNQPVFDYSITIEAPQVRQVYPERPQRPRGPDDPPEGAKSATDEAPADALDAGLVLSRSGYDYGVVNAWKADGRYRGAVWRYLSVVDRLDTADRDEAIDWFVSHAMSCDD